MQTFKLSNTYSIVCQSEKTRNGFKHTASLIKNGSDVYTTKICYLNRTWESFEYQSVLQKMINNYFKGQEVKKYLKAIEARGPDNSKFKAVSAVCTIGQVLCKDQKEQNTWDKKMLGTIPGIRFPKDFDNLPEKQKKRRLKGAKKFMLENNKK